MKTKPKSANHKSANHKSEAKMINKVQIKESLNMLCFDLEQIEQEKAPKDSQKTDPTTSNHEDKAHKRKESIKIITMRDVASCKNISQIFIISNLKSQK